MSLNVTFSLISAILFVTTLASSIVPVYLLEYFSKRCNDEDAGTVTHKRCFPRLSKDKILQFVTQLGGGILLYTSLVHMLPEIRLSYRRYLRSHAHNHGHVQTDQENESNFYLPDLIVCLGFFCMFAIEEMMHGVLFAISRKRIDSGDFESVAECDPALQVVLMNPDPRISLPSKQTSMCSRPSMFSQQSYTACDIINVMENNFGNPQAQSCGKYVFDSIKILLAFSAHSVFDGILIGVQSSPPEAWHLLLAILSHKLIIAFILSLQVYDRCFVIDIDSSGNIVRTPIDGSKRILWFFGTSFASLSPLGLLMIMLIKQHIENESNNLVVIILSALATGTLLYIVFLEIIDKSLARVHINGFTQLIALLTGFCLMHLIVLVSHDHH